jgi:4'-phosphopantetheinyl transferase
VTPAVSVYVAVLPPSLPRAAAARASRMLSASERERAAGLPPARRTEFLVSRALARTVLARHLGCAPHEVAIRRVGGRPELAGCGAVDFSLSHSMRHCAVAVMSGGRVGVDVDEVVGYPERVATRWFGAGEREWLGGLPCEARARGFFKLWTIKEACGKARGSGLRPSHDVVAEPRADRGLVHGLHWRTWWLRPSTVVSVAAACDDRALEPLIVAKPAIEQVLR